ncbi:MAG: bifunctional hydroxymethylpyrimidine kinase/phosphomethylpyrimidine kinase [Alphaproteobacteria bacterium]|nr:bifunctional hydroxymethylpyrimidine kinase/phosphomethylpyrimidine kinase [Alphaproteobacteria bacterium]
MAQQPKRVLIIAGSDPSGGAGVQADIKTVTALGGYAMAAITALTVQNTRRVFDVLDVPPDFVAAQIEACVSDIGVDAVKIGMLPNAAVVAAVASALADVTAPIVLDPVLIATSGDALADGTVAAALIEKLAPRAAIITPNTDELSALTGGAPVRNEAEVRRAAERLCAAGAKAVLAKGAHLPGESVVDALVYADGARRFQGERIGTHPLHGTGCTLASAIATRLAQGKSIDLAVAAAIEYVRCAIRAAQPLGQGARPLGAWHDADTEDGAENGEMAERRST